MFTGIVEAMGHVRQRTEQPGAQRLTLEVPVEFLKAAVGESVAINGACLTVVANDSSANTLGFDVIPESLSRTNLGALTVGDSVNLERALRLDARLDGHYVQGHVDATGILIDLSPKGQDYRLEVSLPPEIHALCIDKGSLCIDGISLTIAELTSDSAVFWITPHTLGATHLGEAKIGQVVNLEADLLAKYVKKLLLPE